MGPSHGKQSPPGACILSTHDKRLELCNLAVDLLEDLYPNPSSRMQIEPAQYKGLIQVPPGLKLWSNHSHFYHMWPLPIYRFWDSLEKVCLSPFPRSRMALKVLPSSVAFPLSC